MATKEEILDSIADMTVLELSQLLKDFEEKFGVTAAAPVAAAAPAAAGGGGDGAAAAEEQDEFDVVLDAAGDKKIQVIKEVRALTSLGLKEAKDLVDNAPKPVLEKASKEDAEKAKAQRGAAGASFSLNYSRLLLAFEDAGGFHPPRAPSRSAGEEDRQRQRRRDDGEHEADGDDRRRDAAG